MTFNLGPILAQKYLHNGKVLGADNCSNHCFRKKSLMGKFEVHIIAHSNILGPKPWVFGIKIKYSSLTALGNDFKPTLLTIKGLF